MNKNTPDPATVCNELLHSANSLQMATLGEDGQPHCGYTPFLRVPGSSESPAHFYIFVSELALHTRDLMANLQVSIMIIEDESKADQVFARTRVSYHCKACEVPRDAQQYGQILDGYEQRHGKVAGMLRQLPDFHLFCLTPVSGQFVMGFGRAFSLQGAALERFEHSRRA